MSEQDTERRRERRIALVLAGLLLVGVVSISFYQLDHHPAFLLPSEEFIEEVDEAESGVILAHDPVALAALEQQRDRLDAQLMALDHWPPTSAVFVFGSVPGTFDRAGLERKLDESVWSLHGVDADPIPHIATATVEVKRPDGDVDNCPRDAEGHHRCGEHGWQRVGQREVTVDGQSTSCIWAHPLDDGTLRIRFTGVTTRTDDARQLHIDTALRDEAVGTGEPVEFLIRADDRTRLHRHDDRTGWQTTRVPRIDEPAQLNIEVSADDPGRRHTCFRFELR